MRLTFKSKKALAVAAVIAAITGAAASGTAGTASAATPSCGMQCLDVYSKDFGSQFVMDVYKRGTAIGTPIILFQRSNSDPALDFSVFEEGQVSDFFQAGLVSSALNLHDGCGYNPATGHCSTSINPATGLPWPDEYAFELQYTPYGVGTGECVGTAVPAAPGVKVSLQPCGVSAKTVWVADTADSCARNPFLLGELPAINGSDANFSQPLVLTYPDGANPVDKPRKQFETENLTGFTQPTGTCDGAGPVGSVNSNQLFTARVGVLP